MIYTGKQNPTKGHFQTVTMQLLEDLFGRYRTLVAGNFLPLGKRYLPHWNVEE